jgi:galactose mutarotase-like enzyme
VPPAHETTEILFEGYRARALISHAAGVEAVFTPQIGMLGCSLTHNGEELLGQRGGLPRYEATGSTMGIPLLHPWANRLAGQSYTVAGRTVDVPAGSPLIRTDPNGLPIHGVVNASPHWEVMAAGADDTTAGLSARLDFGAQPELLEAFPFPHELRIDVTLRGATLAIRTVLTATGDGPVPVAFGYHPYIVLPGVPRTDWHVEVPTTRRLVLDERMIPTGAVEDVAPHDGPLGDRTFDDGYAGIEDGTRFALTGGGRRIELELADGYPFAQVYAPAGEELIAFEPMTAPTNALASGQDLQFAEPGKPVSATFAISVARA